MKKIIIVTFLLLTFLTANVEIVSSKSCKVESLSKSDIKKLFMLKRKSIANEKIVVLDSSNKKLYHSFIADYLNKSVRKIKTYWVRMLFTGKKIPPKKLSLVELHNLEDEETCHISYVARERDMPINWKIIHVK
ncbi:MAG: Unknown protein [uncultured Sulfurovum sp.]|uniref:Uncharacterized protein n=1 Tax=uncultured Sulfurovum sp. TaxID=269237 RepID=A0A6S6T503_9BACT|nr:MAG: Unknown protein [uncultured Sulfurovum sp.]